MDNCAGNQKECYCTLKSTKLLYTVQWAVITVHTLCLKSEEYQVQRHQNMIP